MGGAQGIAVLDTHQVSDEAPGVSKAFGHGLERFDQTRPVRPDIGLERVQQNAQLGEQRADAGLDVARLDKIKAR